MGDCLASFAALGRNGPVQGGPRQPWLRAQCEASPPAVRLSGWLFSAVAARALGGSIGESDWLSHFVPHFAL